MPFLMHIAFSTDIRLKKHVYYIEYGGVRFKLIQNNPRKWADVLLTLLPVNNSAAEQRAYSAAGEFLSALSWANNARILLQETGGMTVTDDSLKEAKCRIFTFPLIPIRGFAHSGDIQQIPHIRTNEQRLALTLFREALSSNKIWLSFLFYWQIMDVGRTNAIDWINTTYYKRRSVRVSKDLLTQLPLHGRRLGNYLQDECRDAIAHIRREEGKKPLHFDVCDDNRCLGISTKIVEEFARHYIRQTLCLNRHQRLVRSGRQLFPAYEPQLDNSDNIV